MAAVASAAKRVDEQRSIGRTRGRGADGKEVGFLVQFLHAVRHVDSEQRAEEWRSKERGRGGFMVRGSARLPNLNVILTPLRMKG